MTTQTQTQTQRQRLEALLVHTRNALEHLPLSSPEWATITRLLRDVLEVAQNDPKYGGTADGTIDSPLWHKGMAVLMSLRDLRMAYRAVRAPLHEE